MSKSESQSYYADTAYTEKSRNQQPAAKPVSEFGKAEQNRRVTRLPENIVCNELLAKEGTDVLRLFSLNNGTFEKEVGNHKVWQEMGWDTLRNKKSWFRNIKIVLFFFSIAAFLATLIGLYKDFEGMMQEPEAFLVFIVPIFGICLFGFFENKTNSSNIVIFNRRTGMVSIPRKGQKSFVRPFSEFVPYSFNHAVMMGTNYHLYLAHRSEEIGAVNLAGRKESAAPLVDWALLVQFMDVTQPLPDLPIYEPFRHHDPVTAEYDKKVGRPERYWRDMKYLDALEMLARSEKKLREFDPTKPPKKISFKMMQWPAIQRYEKDGNVYSIVT